MKKSIPYILALVVAVSTGVIIGRALTPGDKLASGVEADSHSDVLYWVAPMDPNYRRDKPGKSPMGMDLLPVHAVDVAERAGIVTIDPSIASNLGVRTTIAEFGPVSRRIETVAYVAYDEDTLHHVHTRVEGWIENLETKATGDRVEKGQVLFELYSPTLVNAQEEYLAALRSNNAPLQRASRIRLIALGVTQSTIQSLANDRKVSQRIPVFAETDGVIADLAAREGMFVTPSLEVMSVAKLDRVWVLAEILERQAAWVQVGQEVEVSLNYLPGRTRRGNVDYIYPELDPVTRTLKVRLKFDNSDGDLRPNMFAQVVIHGNSTGDVVHVPKEAVIRGGSIDRVVQDLGDGKYKSVPVTIGIESGNRLVIRSGLNAGDLIVTSAQFLIDSESNIESALSRIDDELPNANP